MSGRPMADWILVAGDGVRADGPLDAWVAQGVAFARSRVKGLSRALQERTQPWSAWPPPRRTATKQPLASTWTSNVAAVWLRSVMSQMNRRRVWPNVRTARTRSAAVATRQVAAAGLPGLIRRPCSRPRRGDAVARPRPGCAAVLGPQRSGRRRCRSRASRTRIAHASRATSGRGPPYGAHPPARPGAGPSSWRGRSRRSARVTVAATIALRAWLPCQYVRPRSGVTRSAPSIRPAGCRVPSHQPSLASGGAQPQAVTAAR